MMDVLAFCSPNYEDAALNELKAAIDSRVDRRIEPGVFLMRARLGMDEAIARVEAAPFAFTFTRQIVIGLATVALSGVHKADAQAILEAATPQARDAGRLFVCHPDGHANDVLAALQEALAARLLARQDGGGERRHALAVVVSGETAYVGLALLSVWPAARPSFPDDPMLVSRAAFKLLEAFEVFGVSPRPGTRALDLGASPGGWTQVLAHRGVRVDAVDPGALDPRAAGLPGVTIHRMLAQTFLAATSQRFDTIVNDMRLDARESARIMATAAGHLAPDGVGLMTFKLPERAPTTIVRQALALLRPAYPVQEARCLYYNRREITVCLHKG